MPEFITFWITPRRFMAGNYPGSPDAATTTCKLQSLLAEGVRTFVDLTESGEVTRLGPLCPYENDLRELGDQMSVAPTYHRFPIRDLGVPTRGLMTTILDTLDDALANGAPAYVHCLGGRGRTGVVVGCYLVRHADRLLGATDAEAVGTLALGRITELRSSQGVPLAEDSPQTRAQREMVLGWRPGL